jgi:hypothetical protein
MGAKRAALANAVTMLHKPEESHLGFPTRCVECRKIYPCLTIKIVSASNAEENRQVSRSS